MSWQIEEAGIGGSSESCFIMIDPSADIDSLLECCAAMVEPDIKRVYITFDTRCSPMQIQAFLKAVKDVMPEREYIVKRAEPRILALVNYLWKRMQAYCGER